MDQFFGIGGSFDIEGQAGAFFGAYNQGSKLSASGYIGRCAGFMMQGGSITGQDGSDDDLECS